MKAALAFLASVVALTCSHASEIGRRRRKAFRHFACVEGGRRLEGRTTLHGRAHSTLAYGVPVVEIIKIIGRLSAVDCLGTFPPAEFQISRDAVDRLYGQQQVLSKQEFGNKVSGLDFKWPLVTLFDPKTRKLECKPVMMTEFNKIAASQGLPTSYGTPDANTRQKVNAVIGAETIDKETARTLFDKLSQGSGSLYKGEFVVSLRSWKWTLGPPGVAFPRQLPQYF
ncbi:unnamed protein product [Vitrella brassicaformis CCMP3155]|uniref:Uncharacterized protein n=1 Tax=Vitrella brassicaformis (strain CCMP3155) TaxID=1169540 RepID=A0A0G4EEP6_VITBC|nr:unnamed protein product [Vitrella brassicaformis CCMP3155]|eukprot:CEL94156.1 unnamed protein product [Vitrella brassicaformis CCMP3155]